VSGIPRTVKENWRVVLAYGLAALFILLPLLKPGYILTLDMVFTPMLAMPTTVTSSYLLHAGLHLLNLVIPSEMIEKMLLFTILFLSGLGMHRLLSVLQSKDMPAVAANWGRYAAGLLYMINPFTYSRFMAGQYSVLLGYACLPFFVAALWRLLNEPSLKKSMVFAAWAVGISIVSIHTLGLAAIVALATLGLAGWRNRKRTNRKQLKQFMQYSLAAGFVFFIVSSYWLLPLMRGTGATATSIATFKASDQTAFATVGDGVAGKLLHVMRLQGFWGERQNLYLLPQDELRAWGLFVVVVWGFVATGIIVVWRQNRETAVFFVSCIAIAALLAAGVGTVWLVNHMPLFAGYREPQKFVAVVALGFAVFAGFAVSSLVDTVRTRFMRIGTAIALLFVLVGFTPVMFRGFDGQLTPRHYPADWFAVNRRLNADADDYHVLFLPWHLYMRYQFAGRVIADPGDAFFDKPLLVSDNPELGSVGPAVPNAQKQLIATHILPHASTSNTLGHQLIPLRVKYVLLAKEFDYRKYDYLDHQTDLQLVSETATLKLYRNTAFIGGDK
jgi:hypothetical protein